MEKLIELAKDENIIVSSVITNFDKPACVYIPVSLNDTILVKINEQIKIGTPLIKTNNTYITSSISGIVTNVSEVNTYKGKTYALEIHNDYEEKKIIKSQVKNDFKNIDKDKLTKILELQFNTHFTNIKTLVLNAIDDEPYVLIENFYLLNYYDEFLELLDKLAKLFNLDIIICVKSTSGENINKLMECLGMYPNIKLNIVPDLYLLGKDIILKDYLNLSDNTYIIKASLLYDIYNLIKRNRPKTDKLIIITGNAINNPTIFKTKIGVKLEDILNNYIDKLEGDNIYIANGLMMGKEIDIKDFIITEDINSILVMKRKEEKKSTFCINCGACTEICPANISPILLKNKEYLKYAKNKCLKCGLCSYICPSYINFKEYIKE